VGNSTDGEKLDPEIPAAFINSPNGLSYLWSQV